MHSTEAFPISVKVRDTVTHGTPGRITGIAIVVTVIQQAGGGTNTLYMECIVAIRSNFDNRCPLL